MTLNASRQIAQNYAEHPMKDVVLTVPVYFNQAERRALLDVANMTGINVLQLMNDNTAGKKGNNYCFNNFKRSLFSYFGFSS